MDINPVSKSFGSSSVAISPEALDSAKIETPSSSSWTPSRPVYSLPRSENRLLFETANTRNLSEQITKTHGARTQAVKQKIQEVNTQQIDLIHENAKRVETSNLWSVLKKIATSLLSVISIVFGISLLSAGVSAWIGGAMIASGILSLANFGMSETGAWEWVVSQLSSENAERRTKIAQAIPMAIGIIASGLGLVGSIYGLTSGSLQFTTQALLIASASVAVFDGVTTFGKGIADSRLLHSQADLLTIQGLLTLGRTNLDSLLKEIEGFLNDLKAIKAKAKKTVQIISRSNVQLVKT